MDGPWIVVSLVVGLVSGAGLLWLSMRAQVASLSNMREELGKAREERAGFEEKAKRIEELQEEVSRRELKLEELAEENSRYRQSVAELEATRRTEQEALAEQRRLFETKVAETFSKLSEEVLDKNSDRLLKLAEQNLSKFNAEAKGELEKRQEIFGESMKSIQEKLKEFDEGVRGLEKELGGQLKSMLESERRLQTETNNLARKLHNPSQRGKWGEIVLETILKHAGLQEGINYTRQQTASDDDGTGRMDVVVRFASGQQIVIDSKVPTDAFDQAHEALDEDARTQKLKDHARHVKDHARALSRRGYQSKIDAFEFVVLFLPAESLFSVAVENDPTLLEFGFENRVVIASPVQLLGLLRSVELGWKQERLAENAKRVSAQAKELYAGVAKVGEHFSKLKRGLDTAVVAYNETVGSLERNVLPKARRLRELEVTTQAEIAPLEEIDRSTRELQAVELKSLPNGTEAANTVESEMEIMKGGYPSGENVGAEAAAFLEVPAALFEELAESPASGA